MGTTSPPHSSESASSERRAAVAASSISTPLGGDPHHPEHAASSTGGWWWLVALAAIAGAGWHYWPEISPALPAWLGGQSAKQEPPAVRAIPITAAPVERIDLPMYLDGLGTVTALKTVTIRSRVEGEITKIAFSEGQTVHEGELLAEIDPRAFQVQKDQAEGQLARDEATLRGARQNLKRLQQLFDSKIATAQQIDDQQAIVDQLEGAVQADNATIAQAELQLTYSKIIAPISGRIGLRVTDEGNIVGPNDPQGIAVITQLEPIALVFTLPQDQINRVQDKLNPEKPLRVEAYDRALRRKLATGKLLAIDNQVDSTNGTVRLKAEFPNDDGTLFPNQFVNVRLLVETKPAAMMIPASALQRGPNGPYVYIVQPDDTVELRTVIPGDTEAGRTEIVSGVAEGDRVVTAGLDRLRPGAKVSTGETKTEKAAAKPGASVEETVKPAATVTGTTPAGQTAPKAAAD